MSHPARVLKVIQIFDDLRSQVAKKPKVTEASRPTFDANQNSTIQHLERALSQISYEQVAARTRSWTAQEIAEIKLKGRIELESDDRAIKFYRGLIVWKQRTLIETIEKIRNDDTYAFFKSKWPAKVTIHEGGGQTSDVALFILPSDFHRALKIAIGLLPPSPAPLAVVKAEQVAAVLVTMNRFRSARRNPWMNQDKLQAAILETLQPQFPDSSISLSELRETVLAPFKLSADSCCGSGRCAGCTHPNVVFRDVGNMPGPSHLGEAPASTLPLHQIMDRLQETFPNETWGASFWDSRVEFERSRTRPHD